MKKIISSLAIGAAMLILGATSAFAATPNWNVTGSWNFDLNSTKWGGTYSKTMTITQDLSGNITGTGNNVPAGNTWSVTGNVTGNVINFSLNYDAPMAGYVASFVGDIQSNGSMNGSWSDVMYGDLGLWHSTSGAAAAIPHCTPTGFWRDGINMTALIINPSGTVTGDLDATGCNIGVYYDQNGTIDGANIHGSNYFGVLAKTATKDIVVDVKNSNIHNIGEVPPNGSQHGVAIYYRAMNDLDGPNKLTGEISDNTVSLYQKGGITVNGTNATVTATDNTVTGLGKVDFIAQNGIQFGYGSNGLVRGNNISDNFYTGTVGVGPNPGGQNPPGWEYVSGGLLLYQPGDLKNSMNHFSGNQRNVLMVP